MNDEGSGQRPDGSASDAGEHRGGASTERRLEGAAPEHLARKDEAPPSMPEAPECPFCSGRHTELMNAFGSHASVSTYWCRACRSPFEMVKWRG